MIIWRERQVFTLTFDNFCISTPILTLKTTMFMIRNSKPDETIHDPIQHPKVYVELEAFLTGPHTLCIWRRYCKNTNQIARSYMTRQTDTEKREEKNLWCQGVGLHIHENTFTMGNFLNIHCQLWLQINQEVRKNLPSLHGHGLIHLISLISFIPAPQHIELNTNDGAQIAT